MKSAKKIGRQLVGMEQTGIAQTPPTKEFYGVLQSSYDYFNQKLFTGELPYCLITMQRERQVMGHFAADRWVSPSGEKIHEIALNPLYFGNRRLIEVFQTLVHEMCHLWQEVYGSPPRKCYHDREWSKKMQSIGLIPSTTGRPGGKLTGQNMSDYPAANGTFLEACKDITKQGFSLPWVDRFSVLLGNNQVSLYDEDEYDIELDLDDDEAEPLLGTTLSNLMPELFVVDNDLIAARKKKAKVKYHCFECDINVWGKPDLEIICANCGDHFVADD